MTKFTISMNRRKLLVSTLLIASVMMSLVIPAMAKPYSVTITIKDSNRKPVAFTNTYLIQPGSGLYWGDHYAPSNTNAQGKVLYGTDSGTWDPDLPVYIYLENTDGDPVASFYFGAKFSARVTVFLTP